ncbi:MAG TPA: tetratricopeptide repeat protein [Terriglobia bacterium]|nr:tetratricopeptide repeat protein [Terriglobia bacterium]
MAKTERTRCSSYLESGVATTVVRGSRIGMLLLIVILANCGILHAQRESRHSPEGLTAELSKTTLASQQQEEIIKAIRAHKYSHAEELLLAEIDRSPHSSETLRILGGVFFLDGKYLNSAIAYKKAEAITPLDPPSRYTLSMAYIILGHPDWARPELEAMARSDPHNALYPYWLSRLDYDAMRFNQAVDEALRAIQLDSSFTKAYGNLGLCYEGLGQYDKAIGAYQSAIRLDEKSPSPSPWPPLNLGALLVRLDRLDDARKSIVKALRIDPKFPNAHFQLGLILERQGKYEESLKELQEAVQSNPSYADPYYVLGQVYQRLGEKDKAEASLRSFQKLKSTASNREPY